jgi:hypothetical protein
MLNMVVIAALSSLDRRSSGSSVRAAVMCLARMCGKDFAIAPISSGGSDIAAATSLIALRAR